MIRTRPGSIPAAAAVALLTFAICTAAAGVAVAVSDGTYHPERQHCTGAADDSERPDRVEPGCHNATLHAGDGSGQELAGLGTQQTADGSSVDTLELWFVGSDGQKTVLVLGPDGPSTRQEPGRPFDPSKGLYVYFGADDNLDLGEHDSSPQISNGPSDGGAVVVAVTPASLDRWAAALASGDQAYLLRHPLPLVLAGGGACADGICFSVQSQRRTVFRGSGTGSRDAANYEGHRWDPETCAGPSDTRKDCGGVPLKRWNRQEHAVHAEPGFQFYEDPDAQASPEGPYPLPAVYVGTCGVVLGGGPAATFPDSPLTNGAGQLVVPTGC